MVLAPLPCDTLHTHSVIEAQFGAFVAMDTASIGVNRRFFVKQLGFRFPRATHHTDRVSISG